jgi:hypothetical protein
LQHALLFRDNGGVSLAACFCFAVTTVDVFSLQLAVFKNISPLASFFLLLRQKKETKEKATPDRSKARNKINGLRRWGNSAAATVGDLKHSPA